MGKKISDLKNFFGKGGNKFDPSVHRFPEIRVEKIASDLQLGEHGRKDGETNFPHQDSISKTSHELDAIGHVDKLRTSVLNNFETELEGYASRIASVKEEGEHISLLIGRAKAEIKIRADGWKNELDTPQKYVYEQHQKLKKFQQENVIEGPPQEPSGLVTILFAAILALVELGVNASFFAEASPTGYMGGIGLAVAIAFVNVLGSILLGFFSRYKNKKHIGQKIIGWGLIVLFVVLAVLINFSVAHLRSALEVYAWDESIKVAILTLISSPFGIQSFISWLIIGFGAIVSFISFWKGYTYLDPCPGYNRVWDDYTEAVENYTELYQEAHEELSQLFDDSSADLKKEVERRRYNMKSATDAYIGRAALVRNLEVFLEGCNSAANKLLAIYRDENIKKRSSPAPSYFSEVYKFENYQAPKFVNNDSEISKNTQEEIEKIESSVKSGVEDLLGVRESAILSFPKVRDITQSKSKVDLFELKNKEV